MDLNVAAAWLALGKLKSEDAIAAASSALDRGVYSESLGLLLYEEAVWSEVGPLFTRALGELGIAVPTREQALLTLARQYARRIVSGAVTPYEGAARIWWDIANEPGADKSLLTFVGLASEWEDDKAHRAQYEADIMDEARQLLGEEECQAVLKDGPVARVDGFWSFLQSLRTEGNPPCRWPGCSGLSINPSIYCARHHYEQMEGKPPP